MSFDNVDTWWRWLIVGAAFYALLDWATDNLYWIVQGREPRNKDDTAWKRGLFYDGCFPLPIAAAMATLLVAVLAGAL